jgi:hypothetical protein
MFYGLDNLIIAFNEIIDSNLTRQLILKKTFTFGIISKTNQNNLYSNISRIFFHLNFFKSYAYLMNHTVDLHRNDKICVANRLEKISKFKEILPSDQKV